jgi:uncharacterized protein
MQTLSHWVSQSAKTTDPEDEITFIDPFALDQAAKNEPTAFAIAFVAESVRFEYRVAATRKLVIHESLRAWPQGKEQVWYERDWDAKKAEHEFTPEYPTGLPRQRDLEQRTLRNMLYLSKSVAENRKELEPAYRWLVSRFRFLDLSTRAHLGTAFTISQIDGQDSELKSKILQVLKHADIGVVDAAVIESPLAEETLRSLSLEQIEVIRKSIKNRHNFVQPQLSHQGPGRAKMPLDWKSESAGTQRLFALIGPWLDILKNGYTVCVDEIETSMHPIIVRELLKLFFDPKENTGGAQIIFTTHNPLFLDSTLLRRDQVWFTDKDDEGVAHLYPLTNYQPRQGESLIRGYMAGRYGAVPFVPRGLLDEYPMSQEIERAKEVVDG